jgi:hypothetical protein
LGRYGQLKALVELWSPRYIVIDSTDVGAGLSSFLEASYGERVIPFLFTAKSKSDLGWKFLSVIETGRFKDHIDMGIADPVQSEYFQQLQYYLMDIREGPNRIMQWGVPDGTRDQTSGELVHDDLVISAALSSILEDCEWGLAESSVIEVTDPLDDLDDVY